MTKQKQIAQKQDKDIPLTYDQWKEIARSMQWPEDLTQWDKDHDETPTHITWLTI